MTEEKELRFIRVGVVGCRVEDGPLTSGRDNLVTEWPSRGGSPRQAGGIPAGHMQTGTAVPCFL